ncbi:MAG: hypothetical protein RLZZ557_1456 [Bacteroidota bacterium]
MQPYSRRRALKALVFASAGMALIPACMSDRSKSSLLLKKLTISADDEALLAELCETILPKTSTPGAKELSAHLFVLTMVDDCRTKEDQEKFTRGLADFKKFCLSTGNKDFIAASPEERKKMLNSLMASADKESDLMAFFNTTKGLTIQSYTASEYFLTKVQVYELVPGRYHGCVSV